MNEHQQKLGIGAEGTVGECIGKVPTPSRIGRPMGEGTHLLCRSSDDSSEANQLLTQQIENRKHAQAKFDKLGCGTKSGNSRIKSKNRSTALQGELGLRVQDKNNSVETKINGTTDLTNLRPSNLVRLLNSTPLGRVHNDRQLYRHRQNAPWIQSGDKRINLYAYVGFLILNRSKKREPKTRKIRGREVVSIPELRLVVEKQEYKCALTGQPLTPTNFALDHIVPVAEDGDFTAENAQLVLKSVNRAKNTMPEAEFIEMCRQVAEYRTGHQINSTLERNHCEN